MTRSVLQVGLYWPLTFLVAVPFTFAVAAFAAQLEDLTSRWLLLEGDAICTGAHCTDPLDWTSDRALLLWAVLASACACAVLIAVLQARVLRRWIDVGWPWVVATASGSALLWPVAIGVFYLGRFLPVPDWPAQWEQVGGWGWSLTWAVTGLAQFLVLKQRDVRHAGWWVLVTAGGALLGFGLGSWISSMNSPDRWWPEMQPDLYAPPSAWILGAGGAVCAVAVCTGFALVYLLGRSQARANRAAAQGR